MQPEIIVKIVQRVPVKIVIDSGLDPKIPLPLGISVNPTVTVVRRSTERCGGKRFESLETALQSMAHRHRPSPLAAFMEILDTTIVNVSRCRI